MPLSLNTKQTWRWPGGDLGGMVSESSPYPGRTGYGWYRAVWDAARGSHEEGWLCYQDPSDYMALAGPLDITHGFQVAPSDPESDPAQDLLFTFGRGKGIVEGADPLAFGYYAASVARDGVVALWRKVPGAARVQVASGTLPFALEAGTVYRLRLVLSGSAMAEALRFKVWPDAQREPAAFTLLFEDESPQRLREGSSDVAGLLRTTAGSVPGAEPAPLMLFAAPMAAASGPAGGVLDTTADEVWGQPGFDSNGWNYPDYDPTATNLASPAGVLHTADGLLVSDTDNSRILFYPKGSYEADPVRIYGQADLVSGDSWRGGNGPGPDTLNCPVGIARDEGGGLYVADTYDHRVLYYPPGSTTAARVWGRAALEAATDLTAEMGGMYEPTGVAVDEAGLYVCDRSYSRVLFFPRNPDGSWPTALTVIEGVEVPLLPDDPVPPGVESSAITQIIGGGGFMISAGRGVDGPASASLVDGTDLLLGIGAISGFNTPSTGTAVTGEGVRVTAHGGEGNPVPTLQAGSLCLTPESQVKVELGPLPGAFTPRVNSMTISFSAKNIALDSLLLNTYSVFFMTPAASALLNPDGFNAIELTLRWPNVFTRSAVATLKVNGTVAYSDLAYGGSTYQTYVSDIELMFSGPTVSFDKNIEDVEPGYINNLSIVADLYASMAASYYRLFVDGAEEATLQPWDSLYVSGLAPGDHTARLEYIADPRRASYEPVLPQVYSRIPIPAAGIATMILPSRVYGQADLGGTSANQGRGTDEDSPTAMTLYCPEQVLCDGAGGLYIADTGNNRVLHYPQGSTTPDRVYGQGGSFTRADGSWYNLTNAGLYRPTGLALTPDGLWVADGGNDRILFFPGEETAATMLIGQADFTADESYWSPSAASVGGTAALYADATGLYVADTYNSRVLRFTSGTDELGGGGGESAAAPTWRVSVFSVDPLPYKQPRALSFETQPGNGFAGRPLEIQPVLHVLDVDGQLAVGYFGGVSLSLAGSSAGFITGSAAMVAIAGVARYRGFGLDAAGTYQLIPHAGSLEGGASRPFQVYAAEDAAGMPAATDLFGQEDYAGGAANLGGAAGSVTLNDPQAMVADAAGGLWAADTGNNRVLYFPPGGFPHEATVVLGQPDFASTGAGVGLSQMNRPAGIAIYENGLTLFVSDTGNNRILAFEKDESGAWSPEAAHDIGKRNPYGEGAVTDDIWELSAPRGICWKTHALWIADTGHHRVVMGSGSPYIGDTVNLGQPDHKTAQENYNPAGNGVVNALGLSRPVAVAVGHDLLLVLDAGNHRVLGYPVGDYSMQQTPTRVWGQEDYDSGSAPEAVDAFSFGEATGLAVDETGFWVSDTAHNRALHFPVGTTTQS